MTMKNTLFALGLMAVGLFFVYRVWRALNDCEITETSHRRSRSLVSELLSSNDDETRSRTYSLDKTPIRFWLDVLWNLLIGIAFIGFGIAVLVKG